MYLFGRTASNNLSDTMISKRSNTFLLILFVTFPTISFAIHALPGDTVGLFESSYAYDYIPDASYELIEDRLSCIDSEMPLTFNERVQSFVEYFAVRNRDYMREVIRRKNLYFPTFEKYLKKYDIPDELKYLSIVESALRPEARSRVGAEGLWQFMPSTGRMYGLNQSWYVDERRDPEKATEAACKYLKQLYNMFDDWELALAAYNTGPGNVRKAIRRSGYKKNFWEIYNYLPQETRSYVPQFVAVLYTLEYAPEHNLFADSPAHAWETDTILVSQFVSLKELANQLNLCEDELTLLNPELTRLAVSDETKAYPLIIPADKSDFLAANRSAILDSSGTTAIQKTFLAQVQKTSGSTYGRDKTTYRVRNGDVLGVIAQRHRVGVSDLRRWNNIRGSQIYTGQKLTIWTKGSAPQLASTASPSQAVPASKTHLVRPGDSLWEISRRYEGASVDKIKQWNNLRSNSIKPGQKLIIGR